MASLGHPCKFQRVSRLAFVTAATSLTGGQPNFARCMAVSWPGTLYILFRDLLPPDGILPRAKFTLCPSMHHRTSFSGYISSQLRHLSTMEKSLLNSNMSYRCPHNMVNFGLLTAEIDWRVSGTPYISTGIASWQRYCTAVK